MIKNIVFDMGQVLIRWEPEMLAEQIGILGKDRELLIGELFGGLEWPQLDHGTITEEETVQAVCRRVPERLHSAVEELACRWWEKPLCPMPGMEELMKELKEAGYRLYMLSNASIRQKEYHDRIPGTEYLDGRIVSAECGLVKPQYEIYRHLLRTYGLQARESLFIDDSPNNVEAAVCEGMYGIIFRGDVGRLRRELAETGVDLLSPSSVLDAAGRKV